jgi:hypothetical protein
VPDKRRVVFSFKKKEVEVDAPLSDNMVQEEEPLKRREQESLAEEILKTAVAEDLLPYSVGTEFLSQTQEDVSVSDRLELLLWILSICQAYRFKLSTF